MLIQVSQEDIDSAADLLKSNEVLRSYCCPIALALTKVLGERARAFPGFFYLASTSSKENHLPPVCTQFIRDFDRGEPVEPFQFEIDSIGVQS